MAQSVPATEHSVMTAWPNERAAIENMMDNFGSGVYSIVMDSYDYAAALSEVGRCLGGEGEGEGSPLESSQVVKWWIYK